MPVKNTVDTRILGQLLLMQSVVTSLPDAAIVPFIIQGLSDIPGVASVEFNEADNPVSENSYRYSLTLGASFYGQLIFVVKDENAFAPYTDHVRNFVFMLEVILDGRRQRRIVEDHKVYLEQQVLERTAELAKQRDIARQYLDIAGVMLMALDKNGRIVMINKKGSQLLGQSESFLQGVNWFEHFVPVDQRVKVRQVFDTLMSGATSLLSQYENSIINADGQELMLAWNNTLLRNDEGDIVGTLSSAEDISERKRNEGELTRYRDRLESLVKERTQEIEEKNYQLQLTLLQLQSTQDSLIEASRLASLGGIVAGIAHELNTPIGNARMISTTLNEQSAAFLLRLGSGVIRRSEFADFLHQMADGTQLLDKNLLRAVNLIDSFKQVAVDRTSSNRRLFNLLNVTEEVLATLSPALKKAPYRVDIDIEPDIVLDSYPGPLGQVIANLIENALIHGLAGRSEGIIRIEGRNTESGAVLMVADDGHGIAEANLVRVFDPFFTTRLGQGGSGLGLSIVHNIVTGLLGGRVTVENIQGGGAQFKVLIPFIAPVNLTETSSP